MDNNIEMSAAKHYTKVSYVCALVLILYLGGSIVISLIYGMIPDESPLLKSDFLMWFLSVLPQYGIAFPIGALLLRKVGKAEKWAGDRMTPGFFLLLMLVGVTMMYGGNLIGTLLSNGLSAGQSSNPLEDIVLDQSIWKVVFVAIVGPICEEFFFRKELIDHTRQFGERNAIIFSAVTFGLMHMNLYQFFYAFGLGLVFAYAYTRTGKLRYCALMHIIVNTLGSVVAPWILSQLDVDKLNDLAQAGSAEALQVVLEMMPGILYYFAYVGLMIMLAIAGLVVLVVNSHKIVFFPAEYEVTGRRSTIYMFLNVGFGIYLVICLVMIARTLWF